MRPLTRPPIPYTRPEIASRIYNHFITNKNPRCAPGPNMSCTYGSTGCAIGCLLTEEDATSLDKTGPMVIDTIYKDHPRLYAIYFSPCDLPFLAHLQHVHDNYIYPEKMRAALLNLIQEYLPPQIPA